MTLKSLLVNNISLTQKLNKVILQDIFNEYIDQLKHLHQEQNRIFSENMLVYS